MKNKYFKAIIIFVLLCALIITPLAAFGNTSLPFVAQSAEMRGLWVTSAYNLDWPSARELTPAQIRAEIDDILTRASIQGINAVFVQMRPAGDALYPSAYFPWSHLITGTQGQAPPNNFDPLEYWVQQAHALGIEVHAWLNPFRVTFPNQHITNPAQLSPNHPARLNPNLVIAYGTSLFFDPGNPAVRQLIIDGAAELLRNYNIDGIHLDDYFYPSRTFPDQTSFVLHGGGMNLYDWRRENINSLIRDLQRVTHEINPNASFGVSPFAIWRNDFNDPLGSATRGGIESYYNQFADTRRWVLEGWVDYIAPQIYWIEGNPPACYEIVLSWWEDLVAGTDVRLYVGLAPYREVQGREGWSGAIIRQLERNARSPVVRGSIFFRERFMRSDVGDAIGQFYSRHLPGEAITPPIAPPITPPVEPETVPPEVTPPQRPPNNLPRIPIPTPPMPAPPNPRMERLLVAQPSRAEFPVADASGFWFYGSALPNVNLYVNNQLITDRTEEGFFSIFMPLVHGRNTFTFTQTGQASVTRTIVNNAPAPPRPPATMAIAIENVFPATDEWVRPGTTVTLRATAPAGATVTAEIGGQTITLTQTNANLRATETNIVAAQFTGSFVVDATAANNEIVDMGQPVYNMTWNGHSRMTVANGRIRQIGTEASYFVEITSASAWVFPQASTTGGSDWMLLRGQTDRVAAITGDWIRLASGGWVEREHARTRQDATFVPETTAGFFSEGRYVAGRYRDTITWDVPFFPAAQAYFDGTELIFTLGMQSTAPPVFYTPGTTLFSNIRTGTHNGVPAYFMTLSEGEHLEGFYTSYENGRFQLVLMRRRPLTPGNNPFEGFTFVIDAGHGGTDPGAVGPMGAAMPESAIVLAQAQLITRQLEALGANVVRIRETDTFYTLQQRVDINRATKPDMFISLHTNATAETTNATNIRGFTVWFRNENSRPAATTFMDNMYNINPYTNRNRAPSQANFFVCRPMWSPAILLEAGFTNNIHDFSWMINPRRQEEYARAVVNTLLAYYR